jgi:hypothetical protein
MEQPWQPRQALPSGGPVWPASWPEAPDADSGVPSYLKNRYVKLRRGAGWLAKSSREAASGNDNPRRRPRCF